MIIEKYYRNGKWYNNGDLIKSESTGGVHNGDHEILIADKWLPLDSDIPGPNQKLDLDLSNVTIKKDYVSHAFIDFTQEEMNVREEEIKTDLILFCKQEAKAKIVSLLPMSTGSDYRDVEANLLAHGNYLTRLESKGLATPGQVQELDNHESLWLLIEAIRDNSNLIEFDVVNEQITTKDEISNRMV